MQITCIQKGFCNNFDIKNLCEYYDLHLKSNTLLLAVFQNFRSMCLEIYDLDPARFLSAPDTVWKATLQKTNIRKTKDYIITKVIMKKVKPSKPNMLFT